MLFSSETLKLFSSNVLEVEASRFKVRVRGVSRGLSSIEKLSFGTEVIVVFLIPLSNQTFTTLIRTRIIHVYENMLNISHLNFEVTDYSPSDGFIHQQWLKTLDN